MEQGKITISASPVPCSWTVLRAVLGSVRYPGFSPEDTARREEAREL